MDAAGNLVIADTGNSVIRVVAGHDGTFYGQQMTTGDIYTIAGTGTAGYAGDGGPATSAQVSVPAGVAADASGNLLIADTGNSAVRVVAAGTGTFYGKHMTAGRHLHDRRYRHGRVHRGREPRRPCRTQRPAGPHRRRERQRRGRRHRQLPGASW